MVPGEIVSRDGWVSAVAVLEVACFAAYFLKGFSGFGSALVFVPVVAYLFSPATALAGSALVDLFVGVGLMAGLSYRREDFRQIFDVSWVMLVGTVAGSSLAGVVPQRTLLGLMATVVLGFGMASLLHRNTEPVSPGKPRTWMFRAGVFIGGFTGGLVGISGPFIVMAVRPRMDKTSFRKMMVAVFLIEGAVKLLVYGIGPVFDGNAVRVAVMASPAVFAGLLLGVRLHVKVNEVWFARIVGAILLCVGAQIGFQLVG